MFLDCKVLQVFSGELLFSLHTGHFLFVDSCSDFVTGKTWTVFHLLLKEQMKNGPLFFSSEV